MTSWRTLANGVTALRAVIIIPTAWTIVTEQWIAAFALFVIAVATDLADGRVARRRAETSALGGFLDHVTDAVFVAAALAALVVHDLVTPLLPVLVLVAFVQYTLDSRALAGQNLRASWLGRNNGIAYYVCVGIPVVRNGMGWTWPDDLLVVVFAWLLVASTVVSMADRLTTWLRVQRS